MARAARKSRPGAVVDLKPKAEDAPTVISLFAGCGGSSLGYSMAGYGEVLAVEWDDHAVDIKSCPMSKF